ncbi:MAG: AgmX/PglI C-terminal domain-containing protein [candidate division KSB1 bacterium]
MLKSIDRRFLIILLLVLIIEPALIINMILNYQPMMVDNDVAKLQAKYADLFLSEFEVETPETVNTQNELLYEASELAKKMVGEGYATGPALPDLRPGAGTPETRAASREESRARRGVATATRIRAREALSEEVGRVGLLGIITSGSNLVAEAPALQVLDYAAAQGRDLDQTLAEVKTMKAPRLGADYFGPAVGSGLGGEFDPNGIVLEQREVRGMRFTDSGLRGEDVVQGLGRAPRKRVDANREFAVVKREPSLTGFGSRHDQENEAGMASRAPERIRAIVMKHNAAIQDCYRRQLKNNPTLKAKVSVRITIDYTGHVIGVNVVNSTVDLPELNQCIVAKITRWNDFGAMDPSIKPVTFKQTYVFGY